MPGTRALFEAQARFLFVLGYTAGGSLIFYTFTTYMQKYLVNTAGMPTRTASQVMTGVCSSTWHAAAVRRAVRQHRPQGNMLLFSGSARS